MKIVLIVQDEPFYIVETLRRIVEKRRSDIGGIVLLPAMATRKSLLSGLKYYFEFLGPLYFTILIIQYCRSKIFDSVCRLFKLNKFFSPAAVARFFLVPFHKINDVNSKRSVDIIRALHPDIIVSLSATQKFSGELLDLPRFGCINLHSAPLPRYKGVFPTFWIMLNGESKTAVTAHFMDEHIDTGRILLQQDIDILPDDSMSEVLKKVKVKGADIVLEALNIIETGSFNAKDNNFDAGIYFHPPTHEDFLEFKKKGKKVFNKFF